MDGCRDVFSYLVYKFRDLDETWQALVNEGIFFKWGKSNYFQAHRVFSK